MSIDTGIDYSTDPLCKCRPVHGNADTDGICDRCRPKVEAAQDARGTAIIAAFTRLAEQVAGMSYYDLERLISASLRSVRERGCCRLCRGYHDCLPTCAATMLSAVID